MFVVCVCVCARLRVCEKDYEGLKEGIPAVLEENECRQLVGDRTRGDLVGLPHKGPPYRLQVECGPPKVPRIAD